MALRWLWPGVRCAESLRRAHDPLPSGPARYEVADNSIRRTSSPREIAISGGLVIPRKGNDMDHRTCDVPDCDKPSRTAGSKWCAMHYHRWYRHGSVDKVATNEAGVSEGRRYRLLHLPDHPLAGSSGHVYEHRVVLYDAIGIGPHACYWCDTEIDWLPKADPRELQPDHLNNLGDDNRIENLVPSCRRCNVVRGMQRRADALRERGWWSRNDTVGKLGPRSPRVA